MSDSGVKNFLHFLSDSVATTQGYVLGEDRGAAVVAEMYPMAARPPRCERVGGVVVLTFCLFRGVQKCRYRYWNGAAFHGVP